MTIKYVIKGHSKISICNNKNSVQYLSPLFSTRKEAKEDLRKNKEFYKRRTKGKLYIEAVIKQKEINESEKERLRNLSKNFKQVLKCLTE